MKIELSLTIIHFYRTRRETELHDLQRCVEEETRRHEAQLSEMRLKHSAAIDGLQEQLDNSKRVRNTFIQWTIYMVTFMLPQ